MLSATSGISDGGCALLVFKVQKSEKSSWGIKANISRLGKRSDKEKFQAKYEGRLRAWI